MREVAATALLPAAATARAYAIDIALMTADKDASWPDDAGLIDAEAQEEAAIPPQQAMTLTPKIPRQAFRSAPLSRAVDGLLLADAAVSAGALILIRPIHA